MVIVKVIIAVIVRVIINAVIVVIVRVVSIINVVTVGIIVIIINVVIYNVPFRKDSRNDHGFHELCCELLGSDEK